MKLTINFTLDLSHHSCIVCFFSSLARNAVYRFYFASYISSVTGHCSTTQHAKYFAVLYGGAAGLATVIIVVVAYLLTQKWRNIRNGKVLSNNELRKNNEAFEHLNKVSVSM